MLISPPKGSLIVNEWVVINMLLRGYKQLINIEVLPADRGCGYEDG